MTPAVTLDLWRKRLGSIPWAPESKVALGPAGWRICAESHPTGWVTWLERANMAPWIIKTHRNRQSAENEMARLSLVVK